MSLKDEEHVLSVAKSLYQDKMFQDMSLIADGGAVFLSHYSLLTQFIPTLGTLACQGCLGSHQDLAITLPGVQPGQLETALHQFYILGSVGALRDIIEGVNNSQYSASEILLTDNDNLEKENEASNDSVIDFTEAELAYYEFNLMNEFKNGKTVEKKKDMEETKEYDTVRASLSTVMENSFTSSDANHDSTVVPHTEHDKANHKIDTQSDMGDVLECINTFTEDDGNSPKHTSRFKDNRRDSLNCDLCEKDYETVKGLIVHRRKIHGLGYGQSGNEIECPYCGKMAVYIDKHIRKFHREESGMYECEVCKKMVNTSFKRHRGECSSCPFCDYSNSRKVRLVKHIETAHSKIKTIREGEIGSRSPPISRLFENLKIAKRKTNF